MMKQQKMMIEIFERQRDGVILLKKSDKIEDENVIKFDSVVYKNKTINDIFCQSDVNQ